MFVLPLKHLTRYGLLGVAKMEVKWLTRMITDGGQVV